MRRVRPPQTPSPTTPGFWTHPPDLSGRSGLLESALSEGVNPMGMYIIAEPCIGTKDTACVDVCPVDCIHPRKDEADFATAEMLYIDPDVCIQCGNCEPACPVTAIFTEETIPEKWKHFQQVNADWYKNRQT